MYDIKRRAKADHRNLLLFYLLYTFVQSLSRSLSVFMVIWFPPCNVRSKCECAHTVRVGMALVVRSYVHHIYIVTNIQALEGEGTYGNSNTHFYPLAQASRVM